MARQKCTFKWQGKSVRLNGKFTFKWHHKGKEDKSVRLNGND